MPKVRASIRAASATLSGEMLLDGQIIEFSATVDYPKIVAQFGERSRGGSPVDQWKALLALETFIEEQLRGNAQ